MKKPKMNVESLSIVILNPKESLTVDDSVEFSASTMTLAHHSRHRCHLRTKTSVPPLLGSSQALNARGNRIRCTTNRNFEDS